MLKLKITLWDGREDTIGIRENGAHHPTSVEIAIKKRMNILSKDVRKIHIMDCDLYCVVDLSHFKRVELFEIEKVASIRELITKSHIPCKIVGWKPDIIMFLFTSIYTEIEGLEEKMEKDAEYTVELLRPE